MPKLRNTALSAVAHPQILILGIISESAHRHKNNNSTTENYPIFVRKGAIARKILPACLLEARALPVKSPRQNAFDVPALTCEIQ
jgi:hypothetical protein